MTNRRGFLKQLLGGAVAAVVASTGVETVGATVDKVLDKHKPIKVVDVKDSIDWKRPDRISPEALEDIRNWGVDEINEETRREIMKGFAPVESNPYSHHLCSINISCDLDREEIYELGRRGPYHRYVKFPVDTDHPLWKGLVGAWVPGLQEHKIYDRRLR